MSSDAATLLKKLSSVHPCKSLCSFSFLDLPRELRDKIYENYVYSKDGYMHNFETNKLTRANGEHVNLSLMLANRQIAQEMRGLALGCNTVTFSTSYSTTAGERTGLQRFAFSGLWDLKIALLNELGQLITPEVAEEIARIHPRFGPMLDYWRFHGKIDDIESMSIGETPSVYRDFIHLTLERLSTHPDYIKVVSGRSIMVQGDIWTIPEPRKVATLHPDPWTVLDSVDISEIFASWGYLNPSLSPPYRERRYRFSAACACIKFLESISSESRSGMRKVLVLEDYEALAFPECHARGLIAFCQQNPKLRIERKVSLWRNILPMGPTNFLLSIAYLQAVVVTASIAPWISEALELSSLGMPSRSFTLTIDGDPTPQRSCQVFQVLQRDAAWQTALARSFPSLSWFDKRKHSAFLFECLPRAMGDLATGQSVIRCNFGAGSAEDVEQILKEHEGWSLEKWEAQWASHQPSRFETEAPLPPWRVLCDERFHRPSDD